MITQEMVRKGLETGVVKLITSPNDREPACQIGERWFYYATDVASGMTSEQYLKTADMNDVVRRIVAALNDIKQYMDDSAEYLYYEAILREIANGNRKPATFIGVIKETLRKEVPIAAATAEEAYQKLVDLYNDGSIVLTADDYLKNSMEIRRSGENAD